jgi:hypothetical protein
MAITPVLCNHFFTVAEDISMSILGEKKWDAETDYLIGLCGNKDFTERV